MGIMSDIVRRQRRPDADATNLAVPQSPRYRRCRIPARASSAVLSTLTRSLPVYPPIEPYAHGHLDTGDGHHIYW